MLQDSASPIPVSPCAVLMYIIALPVLRRYYLRQTDLAMFIWGHRRGSFLQYQKQTTGIIPLLKTWPRRFESPLLLERRGKSYLLANMTNGANVLDDGQLSLSHTRQRLDYTFDAISLSPL
jgi:hypothetical protein